MNAKVGSENGQVTLSGPMTNGQHFSLDLSPDQAERMAHAILLQAYIARGNRPGERQFRTVRGWVLR